MKKSVRKVLACSLAAALAVTGLGDFGVASAAAKTKKITMNTKTVLVKVKKTYKLKVKSVKPAKASKKVTYKVANKKIATVSAKGLVKGKKVGTTTVKVTSKVNKKATAKVKVIVAKVVPNKVTLNKKKVELATGSSIKLKATIKNNKKLKKNAKTLTWTSSKKKVASVNKSGKVTAKTVGTAKITVATLNGKKATCTVTVTGGSVVTTGAAVKPAPTTPAATKAPATKAPATQAPATQAPATEAPTTEAPATEAPATEAPATEAPATEAPATEAPATQAPATEAPTQTPNVSTPSAVVATKASVEIDNGVKYTINASASAVIKTEKDEVVIPAAVLSKIATEGISTTGAKETVKDFSDVLEAEALTGVLGIEDPAYDKITISGVEGSEVKTIVVPEGIDDVKPGSYETEVKEVTGKDNTYTVVSTKDEGRTVEKTVVVEDGKATIKVGDEKQAVVSVEDGQVYIDVAAGVTVK